MASKRVCEMLLKLSCVGAFHGSDSATATASKREGD